MCTFIFLPDAYCDSKFSCYYLTPIIKIHSIFHCHFQIYIVKTLNWTHEKCMAILSWVSNCICSVLTDTVGCIAVLLYPFQTPFHLVVHAWWYHDIEMLYTYFPMCGNSTILWWILILKASNAELWCLLCIDPEWAVEQTVNLPMIWNAIIDVHEMVCSNELISLLEQIFFSVPIFNAD